MFAVVVIDVRGLPYETVAFSCKEGAIDYAITGLHRGGCPWPSSEIRKALEEDGYYKYCEWVTGVTPLSLRG